MIKFWCFSWRDHFQCMPYGFHIPLKNKNKNKASKIDPWKKIESNSHFESRLVEGLKTFQKWAISWELSNWFVFLYGMSNISIEWNETKIIFFLSLHLHSTSISLWMSSIFGGRRKNYSTHMYTLPSNRTAHTLNAEKFDNKKQNKPK